MVSKRIRGCRCFIPCPGFRCSKCKKTRPWCQGASDDQPDWCDLCWMKHDAKKGKK